MNAPADNRGDGSGHMERQAHSTPDQDGEKFRGTDNPRYLRALNALLRRPMPREHIDREAGCSNGPDLVAELRSRGLAIPCDKTDIIDRDGREVKRGIYHLSASDRRKVIRWLTRRTCNG